MTERIREKNHENVGSINISKVLFKVLIAVLILSYLLINIPYANAEEAGTIHSSAESGRTEAEYRVRPLKEMLAALTSEEIEAELAVFSDMDRHWSRQAVGKLTALEIVAGSGGRFMPDDHVKADQFLKMALRALGHKIEENVTGYWAQPYIDMALRESLVLEGEIPDYKKPLSREQMAVIAVRTAMKIEERPDSKYDRYIIGKVIDYNTITDSMKQDVLDAYKIGIVEGSGGKFNPKGTLTRAEAVTVIVRLLDMTERRPMKPGPDEVIKLIDNLGNPMEIYPGTIKEYFEIEKAMEKALPVAKGYAILFYSPETGAVCVDMYKSYEAWKEDYLTNTIATFHSNNVYNDPYNSFAYTFSVWQKEPYKELFADYVKEILKALFSKDAQKAIALHDKYLNIKEDKPDGSNYWEIQYMNDRYTDFIGGSSGFSIRIKLKGEK